MKKILTITFAIIICLSLTGCGMVRTEKLTKDSSYYKTTVKAPKSGDYTFKDDLKEKPKYAPYYPSFVLTGKKVNVYFEKNSYTYQTNVNFKKDYPDMAKRKPNLKDMNKASGHNKKIFKINGHDAIRIDYRYGAGSGELKGYDYLIDTSNLRGGGYMSVVVLPVNEKDKIKDLINDKDVKVIIDSIEFVSTEKK